MFHINGIPLCEFFCYSIMPSYIPLVDSVSYYYVLIQCIAKLQFIYPSCQWSCFLFGYICCYCFVFVSLLSITNWWACFILHSSYTCVRNSLKYKSRRGIAFLWGTCIFKLGENSKLFFKQVVKCGVVNSHVRCFVLHSLPKLDISRLENVCHSSKHKIVYTKQSHV